MKGLGQVFKAILSSMIGVGKRENLAKDCERTEKQGPWLYIIVGLVMTVVFIVAVVSVVQWVLSSVL